ncbi:hypothetical protein CFBP5507_07835 [Agrobacterium salinitolerans]|uniref:Uncharacterized protein n=1 Tax=Agrobacterium salinitolerans TaxID=1183413 RepID=A0A9X9K6W9_9HYPH|nr:hypothetical protein [Agrobacterium salinitolerans]UYZ06172.1 hypothetical protein CFBP5507_07835 [Agrobacterium salinitolerans]
MKGRFFRGINFYDLMLFNSDAGGGGGGGGDAAAAAPPAASSAAAPPPVAAAAPPSPSAVAPPAGVTPPPAGDIYKPEGIADHMLGKSNNETIDNLHKALNGYRERDAANKVPDKAEAYGEFTGNIPETIKPHLETLASDPISARMQQYAFDNKVPLPVYQGMVQQFLSVSSELGLMEPVIDEKAERAALVPDVAKHLPEAEQRQAVEKRMNENYAFLDSVAAKGAENGGLAKDDVEFAKAMLGDSAKGHRVFEWIRGVAGGGNGNGPAMQFGGAAATDPRQDLARRAALPENTWGHKSFNKASYDQLQADYKKHIGD